MKGHVFSAALRLYRSHLKSYLFISLIANLWLILPFALIIPAGIIIRSNFSFGRNLPLFWLIAALLGVLLFFYSLGKYWVNAAVLSKLAFCELVNQPETVSAARIQVAPHLWGFIFANILLVLIFTIICILCIVLVCILAITTSGSSVSKLGYFFGVLIIIQSLEPSLKLFSLISAWLCTRLFIFELPLAIESHHNFFSTITRSWVLTQGNSREVFSILFLMGLITLPLEFMVFKALEYSFSANLTTFICLLLSLPLLVKVITLPLWQAIKGAVYYDLRNDLERQITLDYQKIK